jgi:predicted phage terminase large subunit-like protein
VLVSRLFPPWILGRHPDWEVVCATYNQEIANLFGRYVRSIVNDPIYKDLYPAMQIDPGSNAQDHVETLSRGSYTAVGIGGGLTGRGARILVIDDPVKDREDADSETIREKTWDWYASTARTRLAPGGGIIVLQCMTGDTAVRRPDGTETPLRDIRPGDRIATCDRGRLAVSTVKNWTNVGADDVLAIRLASGQSLRANERHPFLVYRPGGGVAWVRVRHLVPGDLILRVRDTANGLALPAPATAAESPSSVADSARSTTTHGELPAVTDHPATIPRITGTTISSTAMGSPARTLTRFSPSSRESAQSVREQQKPDLRSTGRAGSASTTAIEPGAFADCSATTATSSSAEEALPNDFWRLSPTCDFTTDEVLGIEPDGYEDVFDLEVARTENFIANGCVSHNTRWHEDDLSGRLIEQAKKDPGADQWHVFEYPALAYEGELFREKGEALHPERFGVDSYEKLRRSIPARDWNALYQQRPAPEDGDYFRADWFKKYNDLPSALNRYLAVDLAVGTTTANDYTVIAPFGVDSESNIYFLKNVLRSRLTAMESVENILRLAKEHNVLSIAIEKGHISKAIGPYLAKKMREDGKFYHIHEFTPSRDKMTRATSLRARMQHGKVFFPNTREIDEDWRPEFMAFPAARHDDTVDACAYAALMLEDLIAAPSSGGKPAKPEHEEGSYDALMARGKPAEPVSQFNLYGKAKKPKNAWADEGKHYVR